ncbi:MAG TPA: choice-of-anchor Q domain-containing protein [Actinomycetota bacterium]|nr:choice-of-anchor Q domain-containing protein [Actinomycetota bacterium]
MSRNRPPLPVLAICALLALGVVAAPAHAGGSDIWTFPDTCPGSTLQDCVDAAMSGDTIEIATDTPIQEVVTIDHSLTIRPAAGFHPTVFAIAAGDGSNETLGVFLEDLNVPVGVLVRLTGGSGHHISLHHLTMNLNSVAVGVSFDLQVPSTVEMTNTTVRGLLKQTDLVSVLTSNTSGLVTFRAVGNRLFGTGADNGGGGFSVQTSKAGSVRADFDNNSVWDVRACCGAEAGISLNPRGPSRLDANVVGNTLDHNGFIGLNVRNDLLVTGGATVDAFDNVISNNGGSGIELDSAHKPTLEFHAGHNDFFGNASPNFLEGHSAGPGNLAVNPQFVHASTGGLALRATSPLIDIGLVCSPGGVAIPDAAGNTRLAGPGVDMGAFERNAGPVTGVALVGTGGPDSLNGTPGADILCGMGGNDELDGDGGGDWLDGGAGGDALFGRGGPDRLFGGPGNDPCLDSKDGVHGNDRVDGGAGNDGFLTDPGDVRTNVEHPTTCN